MNVFLLQILRLMNLVQHSTWNLYDMLLSWITSFFMIPAQFISVLILFSNMHYVLLVIPIWAGHPGSGFSHTNICFIVHNRGLWFSFYEWFEFLFFFVFSFLMLTWLNVAVNMLTIQSSPTSLSVKRF